MEQEKELIAIFYSTRSVGKKEKKKKNNLGAQKSPSPPEKIFNQRGRGPSFSLGVKLLPTSSCVLLYSNNPLIVPSPSAILFAISNGEREQSKSPKGREGSLITAEKSLCGNLPYLPTFPFSVFVMKLPLNVVDLTRPRTRNIDSLFQLAREKRLFE